MKSLRLQSCCTRPFFPGHICPIFQTWSFRKFLMLKTVKMITQISTVYTDFRRALLRKHSRNSHTPLFSTEDPFNLRFSYLKTFPLNKSLKRCSIQLCNAYNRLLFLTKQRHSLRKIKPHILNEENNDRITEISRIIFLPLESIMFCNSGRREKNYQTRNRRNIFFSYKV